MVGTYIDLVSCVKRTRGQMLMLMLMLKDAKDEMDEMDVIKKPNKKSAPDKVMYSYRGTVLPYS